MDIVLEDHNNLNIVKSSLEEKKIELDNYLPNKTRIARSLNDDLLNHR